MDSLSNLVGSNDRDNLGSMFSLTYTQRMYAFIGCIITGFVISFLSTLFLSIGLVGLFAILYTVGNVISLFSTGFIIGFKRQLGSMFASSRILATILYIVMMVLTLVVAIVLQNKALVFVCIILQYLALVWYSLSYIPYARAAVGRMFQ
eukprot:NODE_37_length_35953_cov_1.028037.p11 type:complete len:149 gc:universal NODE_37_length_35953_cov_1.028037:4697-4251(-)